jgi:hypothetical protein
VSDHQYFKEDPNHEYEGTLTFALSIGGIFSTLPEKPIYLKIMFQFGESGYSEAQLLKIYETFLENHAEYQPIIGYWFKKW